MLSTLSKRRRQGNNTQLLSKQTIVTPSNFFATLFTRRSNAAENPVPPPDPDRPVAAPDPEREFIDYMDEASRDSSSRPTAPSSTVLDSNIAVMWDTHPPLPAPAPTITIQSIRHRLPLVDPLGTVIIE